MTPTGLVVEGPLLTQHRSQLFELLGPRAPPLSGYHIQGVTGKGGVSNLTMSTSVYV